MTFGQMVDILAILSKTLFNREVDWSSVPCETAQSIITGDRNSFANQFVQFLANCGRVILGDLMLACAKTFDPKFIGKGWTIWKGPADGNGLEGEEERDKRADELSVIDWEEVLMETHLQENETSVHGEEKLKRAKASGNIQLGDKAFISLWEDYKANGNNSALEKLRLKGVKIIYFFGTVLRSPDGSRCVLFLYLDGSVWDWVFLWLGNQWGAGVPSASLKC